MSFAFCFFGWLFFILCICVFLFVCTEGLFDDIIFQVVYCA